MSGDPLSSVDSVDAFLLAQGRARRRRGWAVVAIVVLVAGAAVGLVVWGTPPERAGLAQVRRAIPDIPFGQRASFAAAALADVEQGRLPEPLLDGYRAYAGVSPDMRHLELGRALADPRMFAVWATACPSGPRALAEANQLVPDAQVTYFCARCSGPCQRLGPSPSGHVLVVAAAALTAEHLARAGDLDPTEEQLLHMLAAED